MISALTDPMLYFAIGSVCSGITIAMFYLMAYNAFDDKDNFWGMSAVWVLFNTCLWFALTPCVVTLFLLWLAYKYYDYNKWVGK